MSNIPRKGTFLDELKTHKFVFGRFGCSSPAPTWVSEIRYSVERCLIIVFDSHMLPYYHYVKTRFSTVTTVSGVVVFYRTHRQGVLVPPIRASLSNPMQYETALRHNLTVGVIETSLGFSTSDWHYYGGGIENWTKSCQ